MNESVKPCWKQNYHEIDLSWKPGASVCVIAAAPGYPGPPIKGLPISLPKIFTAEKQIFHAGTALQNEQLVQTVGVFLELLLRAQTLRKPGSEPIR